FDPGHPTVSVFVDVVVDGHPTRRVLASRSRADVDRVYRIHGNHGYTATFAWKARVHVIGVYAHLAVGGSRPTLVGTAYLNGYRPPVPLGTRIVTAAKQYVGKTPYVDGGTTPRGFDCSGYTQYVYRQAKVASLPRTAEQQRRAMRIIPASLARPGDLVFYLGGGGAYHVAIYAGGGMQYAAATPRDGIRYQHVWSSAVQYGTDWH
ncbi:MAG: hypothetical protein JWO57_3654, partial [Pseudonocardiales bacterium]|nr:hypothetical protein [Pseudonocardiales bacterium]